MNTIETNASEPQDSLLLLIDELLSSGWTSKLDMSLLFNRRLKRVDPEGKTDLAFYKELMHPIQGSRSGGVYTSLINASINKLVDVWTRVYRAEKGTANMRKRDAFIVSARVSPKEIKDDNVRYSLSEATISYLKSGYTKSQPIAIFRYRQPGYSIADDLRFYNAEWSSRSLNRRNQDILTSINYNVDDAHKYSVFSPDPDVVARKISALKIQALKDALLKDTNEAVQKRLAEIDYLTRAKPEGWGNRAVDLYLNAIYDASTVFDGDELEPIIQQFRTHMLNHFRSDLFPACSMATILDYEEYCPREEYPEIAESIASLARIITQAEFSSEDIDNIRDKCWIVASRFDNLEEDQFQKVATLWDAVLFLMNSTTYVYNISGFSAALTLYHIDSDINLNTIVSTLYALVTYLIHDYANDSENTFGIAEAFFLSKCKGLIGSLNKESKIERFIIGLVEMATSYITRNLPHPVCDMLPDTIIMDGIKELNDEERCHFDELYQTLVFEENYQAFIASASCDVLSRDTQDTFIILVSHLLANLITGKIWLEKGSYHHQKLVLNFIEYKSKVSDDARHSLFDGYLLLLKYTLVVMEYNPYPMDIREGCTPELCKDCLTTVMDEARHFNYNENEYQLLLLLLAAIALRHIDYYIPKEDDIEEESCNKGVKDKAIEFLPLVEGYVNRMTQCSMKEELAKSISSIATNGYFNGYIL